MRAFSSQGYKDVGVRRIAALADCDPSTIRRHFGSKQLLFEKTLEQTFSMSPLAGGPMEGFGERTVAYFSQLEHAEVQVVPMLIFATADPTARGIVLRVLEKQVVQPMAEWIGGPQGEDLAARITMLCCGYFLYGRILPLQAVRRRPEEFRKWLADELQAVVDARQATGPATGSKRKDGPPTTKASLSFLEAGSGSGKSG